MFTMFYTVEVSEEGLIFLACVGKETWAKKTSQATPKKQKDKKKKPKAYWNKGLYTSKLWKSHWWQFIEEKISFFVPCFQSCLNHCKNKFTKLYLFSKEDICTISRKI